MVEAGRHDELMARGGEYARLHRISERGEAARQPGPPSGKNGPPVHLLYALATWIAVLIGWPVLLTHPKLRHGIRQRLGLVPARLRTPGTERAGAPRIWLHGASAGDLLSLQPMMKELKARRPGCFIIVSCITNSGHEIARKKLAEADLVVYAPYDLPGATRRAMRALRPDLLVLEYTEIWPGLIRAASRAGRAHRPHQRPLQPAQAADATGPSSAPSATRSGPSTAS